MDLDLHQAQSEAAMAEAQAAHPVMPIISEGVLPNRVFSQAQLDELAALLRLNTRTEPEHNGARIVVELRLGHKLISSDYVTLTYEGGHA